MADYPADRIFAPSGAVKEIADAGNTPFYLYDKQGIQNSINELHDAFAWISGYQNYFPLRDNLNPQLLQILSASGSGVSVTSKAELEHACRCGFSGSAILYEPSILDPDAEKLAFQQDAVWLLNSAALLPDTLPKKLILRYDPCDIPLTSPLKQTVTKSKNGLNRGQILETVQRLREKGVEQVGLALQISSYNIQSGFWSRKAAILFDLMMEIHQKTDVSIWCCHIGEGPGLPYHPRISAPDLTEEVQLLRSDYDSLPVDFRPILYTGVSSRLMEPHGILVTKVLEERYMYKTFLIFDAGICQYNRPILKHAYRHVSVLGKNQIENRKLYSLVGNLPDSFDRLVAKGRMLPRIEPGEFCVVHDVGCRGRSMPMLYGLRPLAAEYLYEADGTIRQIAKRRSEKDVLDFLTAW